VSRVALFAVFAISALGAAASADDAIPDEATIHAMISAAAGTRWQSERRTVAIEGSGLAGTLTVLRAGDDEKSMLVEGPFKRQWGTSGGQSWRQGENGVTVLVQPDLGVGRPTNYTKKVRRVSTPARGFVVETLDNRGHGSRSFVDGATWHVVRIESVSANGTSVTTYDDFRTIAGRTSAWHWAERDGHAENDTDYRVTSDDPAAVSSGELAIPGFRRVLYTFPPGVDHVELPARIVSDRIYVRLTVANRGLDFLLDTGASVITLDGGVAAELGLKKYDTESAVTAGRYRTGRTILPEVHVGPIEMRDVVVTVLPSLERETPGVKVVGLLGFDFIGQAGMKIDYEHGKVTVFAPSAFAPPHDPDTAALDVRLGSGSPMTSVAINGIAAERFLIDTGAQGSLVLFDYFAQRYPDVLDRSVAYADEGASFSGVGGVISTRPYLFAHLQLGQVDYKNFPGYLVTSKGAFDEASDGVIGSSMLHFFNVWLDYANARVYLQPNALGRRALTVRH
jgi:predicted aspartyl protease